MCMHTHILMMPLILVKESFVFHLRKNSEIRQGGQKSKVGIYLNKSMLSKGASLVVQRVKRLPAMQETWVWSPGLEDGEGNGNPLQYSCLETSMDRGAWWATVHRVPKSRTQLSVHAWMHTPHSHAIKPLKFDLYSLPKMTYVKRLLPSHWWTAKWHGQLNVLFYLTFGSF